MRGALALIDAIQRLQTGQDTSLQVRVGIATGLVVVGDLIGEGDAQERGVVGDTPNLAARLQALAEPGQVVISQGTRRLTGGLFEYRDLGPVALRGLSDPVQAWQVTGASTVQSRFEAQHEKGLTPLVGREEELELLLRRWRQVASGEGRVVLISGEPGIGKSRLTVALEERLKDKPHTRLRYFCSQQHQDSAFYPTISQLERAAGFDRQDTAETKLDKLVSLLGSSPGQDTDIQLLAELLSVPTGGSEMARPFYLGLLAEAYANDREVQKGLAALDEGIAAVQRKGQRWPEAELHRLRGELLMAMADNRARDAEEAIRFAIQVARRQAAKSWELRASTSLARTPGGEPCRCNISLIPPLSRGTSSSCRQGISFPCRPTTRAAGYITNRQPSITAARATTAVSPQPTAE